MWQDLAILTVTFLFGVMLLPQARDVYNGAVVNPISGILYASGMYFLGYVATTLNLWMSVSAFVFTGSVWLAVFILSLRNMKVKG